MAENLDEATESRTATPQIPPGVVASPSEEKLYDLLWRKAEENSEKDIVQDAPSDKRNTLKSRRISVESPNPFELSRSESRMSPTIRGTPQRAWLDGEGDGQGASPLVKVRSNVDSSDEEEENVVEMTFKADVHVSDHAHQKEEKGNVAVATPPPPKGRSTRRVTPKPMENEMAKAERKLKEKKAKKKRDVIGSQDKDDPELLKFKEISSPDRRKGTERRSSPDSGYDHRAIDPEIVTSTPKPITSDEEHLYDDVFTEDDMTFVEKDWDVPSTLNFSECAKTGLTPLHYAASLGKRRYLLELISAIRSRRDPVFNLLTPDGKKHMLGDNSRISYSTMTDMNCLDGCGRTALMHAVRWNRLDCARLMIYEGADISIAMPDGTTCLHQAAFSSTPEIINLLLHHRADPDVNDGEGRTPLHWATNNPSPKVLSALLEKVSDIDINIVDSAGMTPLMWAAYNRKPEHVQILLDKEADASLVDIEGMAAVHWAVHETDSSCLQLLLTRHSSKVKDWKGKTVLHFAAEQGACSCIDLILSVRPNSWEDVDNENRSSLHWAAACDRPDAIQSLLSEGASANVRDGQGRTPYDYAMLKEYVYSALLLSKQNAGHSVTKTSPKIDQLVKGLAAGCWLAKFTKKGRGPICKRLFWINISKGELCWSSVAKPASKDVKSAVLVDMRASPSPVVMSRKDFDPLVRHKWTFSILTPSRVLNLLAYSESDYKFWTESLRTLLTIGIENIDKGN